MTFFRNKNIGCTVLMLFACYFAAGQVLVRSSIDKDYILVGEPVKLTVEARLPLGEKVNWFQLDTIPHFEWIEKGMTQEADGIDGKTITQIFTVTSYDTGYWTIPRINVQVAGRGYSTDTVGVTVAYNAGFNVEEDYREIKQTEEVEVPGKASRRWLFFGAIAIMLLALIYFLTRKKKTATVKSVTPPLTPYDEAIKTLNALKKMQPADAAAVKLYYTGINDVFRTYLDKQFKLSSLEKTNDELIVQVKKLPIPSEQFAELSQTLRLADFVKFARYQPNARDHEKALSVIEAAIHSLHKTNTA